MSAPCNAAGNDPAIGPDPLPSTPISHSTYMKLCPRCGKFSELARFLSSKKNCIRGFPEEMKTCSDCRLSKRGNQLPGASRANRNYRSPTGSVIAVAVKKQDHSAQAPKAPLAAENDHAENMVNFSQSQPASPLVTSAGIHPLGTMSPSLYTGAEGDPSPARSWPSSLSSLGRTPDVSPSIPGSGQGEESAIPPQGRSGFFTSDDDFNNPDQHDHGEDLMDIARVLVPIASPPATKAERLPDVVRPRRSDFLTRLGVNRARTPVALSPREEILEFSKDLGRLSDLFKEAGALGPEHCAKLEDLVNVPWRVDRMALFVEGYLRGAGVDIEAEEL